MPVETYEQALEYLFGRINYERIAANYSTRDFKLERMARLLELIGCPQQTIPAVHIAGTKGKGSTAAMVAEILQQAGYRVGLFTSPHVDAFEERMRVCGRMPGRGELIRLINHLAPCVQSMDLDSPGMAPTYFEIATALAWMHFVDSDAQVAVLEVGLGGRLDATNLCVPAVTAITNISRDHMAVLGSRLSDIAREKAGIIKQGVPVVSGAILPAAQRVVREVSRAYGAPLHELYSDFRFSQHRRDGTFDVTTWRAEHRHVRIPLAGDHQLANASLAVAIADALIERGFTIDESALLTGLAHVDWPLRVQFCEGPPTLVLDAAHNWASASVLRGVLEQRRRPWPRRVLIFATSVDKDVRGMLRCLVPEFDTVIVTRFQNNPRAMGHEDLQRLIQSTSNHRVHAVADPVSAWQVARRLAGPRGMICATGSIFIAAEIREIAFEELPQLATQAAGRRPDHAQTAPCSRSPVANDASC